MFDEVVGALGLAQREAFRDLGVNFLLRQQVEQERKICRKPVGMPPLLGRDRVPAGRLAVGQKAKQTDEREARGTAKLAGLAAIDHRRQAIADQLSAR